MARPPAGSRFVLGHYADVTTPALYGRDINLYLGDVALHAGRRRDDRPPAGAADAGVMAAVADPLYSTSVSDWAIPGAVVAFEPKRARADLRGGRGSSSPVHGAAVRRAFHGREPVFASLVSWTPTPCELRLVCRRPERVAHPHAEPADGRRDPGAGRSVTDVFPVIAFNEIIRRDRPSSAPTWRRTDGRPRRSRRGDQRHRARRRLRVRRVADLRRLLVAGAPEL